MKRITTVCILLLAALPAQAQAQVTVLKPPFSESGGDVVAMGEWQALNKDIEMDKHAVQIRCFRLEKRCVEALATLSSNGQPIVNMNVYKITRWNSVEMFAEQSSLCATVTLRINLLEDKDVTKTYVSAPELPGPDACKGFSSRAGVYRLRW